MSLFHKRKMTSPNEVNRAKPNGYICSQYVDKTSFYLDEALVDLETVVNATLSMVDVYRLVGRAIGKLHRADDSNETVREIYSRRGQQ